MDSSTGKSIVFFDGTCGACNAFVQFLLKRDQRNRFLYSPLQGQTAAARFPEPPDLSTMIFTRGDRVYKRSNAVIESVAELGPPWTALKLLKIVPLPIRDFFYGVFARWRYRLSNYFQSCALLTSEQQTRFLP